MILCVIDGTYRTKSEIDLTPSKTKPEALQEALI
nr:MAG TPA: hypothetical protein [Caudoviricetes sp.]